MVAEEPPLGRVRLGENGFIKLKLIQIRRVFLRNHPHSIMHLQEVTRLVTRIRSAAMPDFAAKKHHVPRIAQDTLFRPTFPLGCSVWRTPRVMTTRDKLRRSQLFIHIVEIVMGGGDEDWNFHARIGTDICR